MSVMLTPDATVPSLSVDTLSNGKWTLADRLYLADVSNMPWARPDLEFLQSKIPFAVGNNYPARGGE